MIVWLRADPSRLQSKAGRDLLTTCQDRVKQSHWNEAINPIPMSRAEKKEREENWVWWEAFEKKRATEPLYKRTEAKISAYVELNNLRDEFPDAVKVFEKLILINCRELK